MGERADVRADGACITDSSRRAYEELGRGDLGLSGISGWRRLLRHGTHVKEVQLCCAPHACVHGLMHLERRWDVGESEHACVAQSTVATAAAASYVAPEVAGGFDVCSYGLI